MTSRRCPHGTLATRACHQCEAATPSRDLPPIGTLALVYAATGARVTAGDEVTPKYLGTPHVVTSIIDGGDVLLRPLGKLAPGVPRFARAFPPSSIGAVWMRRLDTVWVEA